MPRLSELAGRPFDPDPEISGITADSRVVRPGYIFAAIAGTQVDGAKFIPDAEANGAVAVLAQPGVSACAPVIEDENPRRRLALIAARLQPKRPRIMAGVTGTNGKTSTVFFAAQLWRGADIVGGSLGTVGASAPGYDGPKGLTTPDPVALHDVLAGMADAGVEALAMEVSSHALDQHRCDGVEFDLAGFTNISHDHLDYHGTFDVYFDAKARLFTQCLKSSGVGVVNADGPGAENILGRIRECGVQALTTGRAGADVRLERIAPTPQGLSLTINITGRSREIQIPVVGAFQAENAALAAGIVIASGAPADAVISGLSELQAPPGRMQPIGEVNGAGVYVDYAHTPDALKTALAAIRPHANGRVAAIVGAGGDRDASKRAPMGAAACAGADHVIITDDNPRSEDPAEIRRQVQQGCPNAQNIGDREMAINDAIVSLRAGDVLLIAGKGHETGQIVGDSVLPFDDAETARRTIQREGGKAH